MLEADESSPPSSLVTAAYLEPPGIKIPPALPRPERISVMPALAPVHPPCAAPSLLWAWGAVLHGTLPSSSPTASSWLGRMKTVLQEPGDLGWRRVRPGKVPCPAPACREVGHVPPQRTYQVTLPTAAGIVTP